MASRPASSNENDFESLNATYYPPPTPYQKKIKFLANRIVKACGSHSAAIAAYQRNVEQYCQPKAFARHKLDRVNSHSLERRIRFEPNDEPNSNTNQKQNNLKKVGSFRKKITLL